MRVRPALVRTGDAGCTPGRGGAGEGHLGRGPVCGGVPETLRLGRAPPAQPGRLDGTIAEGE